VAYFAALLVRAQTEWGANEIDLDEVDDLGGLADVIRDVAEDETALLLLEEEDTWFALVRVDGDEDPRVFVSDTGAVARSALADVLVIDAGLDAAGLSKDGDEDDDADEDEEAEDDDLPAVGTGGPGGDTRVLADFGIGADDLCALCRDGMLPADSLSEIADRIGFADELEAVR